MQRDNIIRSRQRRRNDNGNNCEDKKFDGCADDAPLSGVEVLASHGRGRQSTTGTQVVHRHPNGLCMITASDSIRCLRDDRGIVALTTTSTTL